ncbi:MAG TPA: MFS transporter [Acidimicrobiales bacterium]|nr:MFS transporter [Acidimicrobiales bacterium]
MPSTSRAPSRSTGLALAVIVTCQLMVVLDATVVNIALAPIQRALHFSPAGLSWVVDAYSLAFGGLLLLGGRAGDIFGRRRMLVAGLALFTLASAVGGLATDSAMLLAARAVQGIGAALASPNTLSLITATFPEGPARNRALGVFTAVSAGGGSLGLVLGGFLTSEASWRWVLFINVPIGLAIIALAPRVVTEPPRNGGRVDLIGAALATGGLTGVTFAVIRLAEHGSAALVAGPAAVGVALLVGFVVTQTRRADPLLPLRLVTDRLRGPSYLGVLLVPSVMFGVFFLLSQYLELTLHFSAIRTGWAFLPLTGMIFLSSRITPRIVASVGARPLLLFGLCVLTVATFWISRATPSGGYLTDLLGPFTLFGIGAGCCFMPLSVVILTGVPAADAGAASGAMQTMQQTGGALGVAALTAVASSHGRQGALEVAAGVIVVALALAFTLIRPARPEALDGEGDAEVGVLVAMAE